MVQLNVERSVGVTDRVSAVCMEADPRIKDQLIGDLIAYLGNQFFDRAAQNFVRSHPAAQRGDTLVAQELASVARELVLKFMRDYPLGTNFFAVFHRRFDQAASRHIRSSGHTGFGQSDWAIRRRNALILLKQRMPVGSTDAQVVEAFNQSITDRGRERKDTMATVEDLAEALTQTASSMTIEDRESVTESDYDTFRLHPAETTSLIRAIVLRCGDTFTSPEKVDFAQHWLLDKYNGTEVSVGRLGEMYGLSATSARTWQSEIMQIAVDVLAEMGIESTAS